MTMIRKIKRNMMKRKLGSNKINRVWRNAQIKRMGLIDWIKSYNACNAKSKVQFKNATTAYIL